MILTTLLLLGVLLVSIEAQKHFKLPSPITLILLSYLFYYLFPNMVLFSEESFAHLVLFLIPILITSDALHLKLEDLKANAFSLFYLAVFSVSLSIIIGLFAADFIFASYALSTGAIIALFAMVLATDPVSVVSVFSSFKVSKRLKILAEGESLFNDATALIIFAFIAIPMLNGETIGASDIVFVSLKVLLFSVAIGLIVGFIGVALMRLTQESMSELVIILLVSYGAFELAEHFHLAGLLSVIVAIITLNTITERSLEAMQKEIDETKRVVSNSSKKSFSFINKLTQKLGQDITHIERHKQNINYISLLAILANTFLFVSMASLVHVELLWQYAWEIVAMFALTTLIRAVMMGKFAYLSNSLKGMQNISFQWWSVLLFAGIKGGLSIVMLQMLPDSFEHKAMFEAVVMGVILLSTIFYALILVAIILLNKEAFED